MAHEEYMRMTRCIRTILFASAVFALSLTASAQVRITVGFGPPAIPVYEQPVCPGDGYIWTPGYWGWDTDFDDYYWVPGTWILAPEPGFLWTPPWWGWDGGVFLFHDGWWGPTVGFYGGINYGFGYFGVGFVGGRWEGGHFFYNREVANINGVDIHNVYNEHVTIVNNSHVSYNGGEGGLTARPTPEEEAAGQGHHVGPVGAQNDHVQAARNNRDMRASVNQGRPSIAATSRPGDFKGGVEAAREAGAPYHPPANRGGGNAPHSNPTDARDLPPIERPAAPNTGNTKLDSKYEKQQQKLINQQNKERQKLELQQEKEHEQLTKRSANDAEKQQVEQRHAQQTQQLQQRHATQMQSLQSRQAPHGR